MEHFKVGEDLPTRIQFAEWDDDWCLDRLLTAESFTRTTWPLQRGAPFARAAWAEDWVHVVLRNQTGRPEAAMQLGRWHDNRIMVDWVGWRGRTLGKTARDRLVWWLYNEVWWGPGAVMLDPAVNRALRVLNDLTPLDFDPQYMLDTMPQAWGAPWIEVEGHQLLGIPPPYVWEADRLVKWVSAPA